MPDALTPPQYWQPGNLLTPPGANGPDWADAYSSARDAIAAQRAKSVALGLLDPDTGLPTQAGIIAAARQYGGALLMGSTTPGIRAFHGSPYDFDAFSTGHIGTGEGAQVYGHGLYFAGNEATAQTYRDKLTSTDTGFNEFDTLMRRFAGSNPSAADVREALTGTTQIAPLAKD